DQLIDNGLVVDNTHINPSCITCSDHLYLTHNPNLNVALSDAGISKTITRTPFIFCNPPKATLATFLPSGAILGLAFPSLSQSPRLPALVRHLSQSSPVFGVQRVPTIQRPIWSSATVNNPQAILTLGGT